MKLGYINYLNCYPFYYHMFEISPIPDVQIFPRYPSDLNRLMKREEIDMSPISAAAYTDLGKDVVLLPDFCLSSVGYVHSVILKSMVPIEELHKKKVGLSSASQTSVVILKILLEHYYSIKPLYLTTNPNPSHKNHDIDAALIIGNEAMLQGVSPYTYDLGDLWLRKTGYPVVFAVFAVRRSVIEHNLSKVMAVINSYYQSLACLDHNREILIQKATARYPSVKWDIDSYYRSLEYTFTPELKDALSFYFSLAGELGLLKKVSTVRYMDPIIDKVGIENNMKYIPSSIL
ncbi:MAG TPA: menaquinone biosynthesis protein [Syntrophales bacterium]|nr:menaquinone biosynthesis protein [Syntrophales bacterium]